MTLNKDGIEGGSTVDYETMMKINNERRTRKTEKKKPAKKTVKKPTVEIVEAE